MRDFLLSSEACLFSGKKPAYYSATHNAYSHIDLANGLSVLFPSFERIVDSNPRGSDHFPVPLEGLHTLPHSSVYHKRFKETCGDWVVFTKKSQLSYTSIKHLQIDEACSIFTTHIFDAARSSVSHTSGNLQNPRRPWWTGECRNARKAQPKAWGNLREYPLQRTSLLLSMTRQLEGVFTERQKQTAGVFCIVN